MYIDFVLYGSLYIVNAGPLANDDKFTSNKTLLARTQK